MVHILLMECLLKLTLRRDVIVPWSIDWIKVSIRCLPIAAGYDCCDGVIDVDVAHAIFGTSATRLNSRNSSAGIVCNRF